MNKYYKAKEFVCPCGADFTKKRMLKQHLSDTHNQSLEGMSVNGLKGSKAGKKLKESVDATKVQ